MNLLKIRAIDTVLRSRLYPAIFQWITAATFAVLLMSMLLGPNNSGQNFGMALTWRVWWPLLPLSFLLFGRLWCAICPFTWVTDVVQRAVGVRLSVPNILRRYGPWFIGSTFILITYLDQAYRFDTDARYCAYLLLAILAVVILFAAFFEQRTFCRYVCFIGAFAGNYSRAGILELRADPGRCHNCSTQACYRGAASLPGCPLFLLAPTVGDSGTCHLCANCVKNCPHDAIRISLRRPAAELWSIAEPRVADAVLAAIMAGVVLIEQFAMLGAWERLTAATAAALYLDPYVSFPIVYAALLGMFVVAPLLALLLASFASQALGGVIRLPDIERKFAFFGYALIPVALAGHLAYSLYHLLTLSRSVPFAFAAMLDRFPSNPGAAWLPTSAVLSIEVAVLVLGGAASVYVAFQLVKRFAVRATWVSYAPPTVLLLLLLAANLYAVLAMIEKW